MIIVDETDDYTVVVPDYLLGNDNSVVYEEGDEVDGYDRSSNESDNIDSDQPDYTDVLLSIDSNTQVLSDDIDLILNNQALILSGQEHLHNDLAQINETLNLCCGLMFSIVVYLVIKIAFSIFNKILGFGSI